MTSLLGTRSAAAPAEVPATGVRVDVTAWLTIMGLFLLALVVRAVVVPLVGFAPNEGSAYYIGVAANLVEGRGLVSDAVWSHATAPHVVPKPAFELWQPLASFVMALPMAIAGPTLGVAQLGMAALGALVAPLAWLVGRDAAHVAGLDARRIRAVAIASGILAAVLGPFVLAVAGPDSTTPFLVFGTLAAVLMPRAIPAVGAPAARERRVPWWPGPALGVALGLAWLSRQEAIWLGAAFLVLLAVAWRTDHAARGDRRAATRWVVRAIAPVVAGGLVTVGPWLLRNLQVFGNAFAGQAVENLWLRRNEDIFAWLARPTAADHLGQGAMQLIDDRVGATVHQLVSVLVLPAFPVGLVGLLALVLLRRSPALRRPTALLALVVAGGATFAATALLFPVATRWGTYLHAAGPFLVALTVLAVLAADHLMARISARRGWGAVNVLLGPVALLAVTLPLLGLQLVSVSRQSEHVAARLDAISVEVRGAVSPGPDGRRVVITDHPMWVAGTIGAAVALPDEPLDAVADLARTYGVEWLLVMDVRGRYPDALLAPGAACLAADPVAVGPADEPAWLARLDPGCRP